MFKKFRGLLTKNVVLPYLFKVGHLDKNIVFNEMESMSSLTVEEIENFQFKTTDIAVYIERKIILELEEKPLTIVDAAVGEVKGKKVGLLFIKKSSDVYGL